MLRICSISEVKSVETVDGAALPSINIQQTIAIYIYLALVSACFVWKCRREDIWWARCCFFRAYSGLVYSNGSSHYKERQSAQ